MKLIPNQYQCFSACLLSTIEITRIIHLSLKFCDHLQSTFVNYSGEILTLEIRLQKKGDGNDWYYFKPSEHQLGINQLEEELIEFITEFRKFIDPTFEYRDDWYIEEHTKTDYSKL